MTKLIPFDEGNEAVVTNAQVDAMLDLADRAEQALEALSAPDLGIVFPGSVLAALGNLRSALATFGDVDEQVDDARRALIETTFRWYDPAKEMVLTREDAAAIHFALEAALVDPDGREGPKDQIRSVFERVDLLPDRPKKEPTDGTR